MRFAGVVLLLAAAAAAWGADARLKNASRTEKNGWVYVHLEGTPAQIGFQHGYLLAPEIKDAQRMIDVEFQHDTDHQWGFFRDAARTMLWPRIETEYRQELQGISDGLKAHGVKLDVYDIVAMNAFQELPYWMRWQKKQKEAGSAEHCSAFVATGSYTKDGHVLVAHNAWFNYTEGARWKIIFDIKPTSGNRILMDGFPGLIHSADDYGINSAGIIITETTITRFSGFDPNGIAEFMRARKAMQYSSSIDDFARIMKDGNNGGYANNWLVADRKTNEIASLELGLKNVTLQRTKDGYFVGSNMPEDPKLIAEETRFDPKDLSNSAAARHVRWLQLMAENKGKLDVATAKRLLADHYDTFDKKELASERTICGHIDESPRGNQPWVGPYGPAGAVQSKVADAAMAEQMTFSASFGRTCGKDFNAAEFLAAHPEYAWQKEILIDLKAGPWTDFSIVK